MPRGSSGRLWETLVETACSSAQDLGLDSEPHSGRSPGSVRRALPLRVRWTPGSVRASSQSVDLGVPDPAVALGPQRLVKGRWPFWVGAQALSGGRLRGGCTPGKAGSPMLPVTFLHRHDKPPQGRAARTQDPSPQPGSAPRSARTDRDVPHADGPLRGRLAPDSVCREGQRLRNTRGWEGSSPAARARPRPGPSAVLPLCPCGDFYCLIITRLTLPSCLIYSHAFQGHWTVIWQRLPRGLRREAVFPAPMAGTTASLPSLSPLHPAAG